MVALSAPCATETAPLGFLAQSPPTIQCEAQVVWLLIPWLGILGGVGHFNLFFSSPSVFCAHLLRLGAEDLTERGGLISGCVGKWEKVSEGERGGDRQLPPSPHPQRIVEIYFGKTHRGGLRSPSFPWQQAWGDCINLGPGPATKQPVKWQWPKSQWRDSFTVECRERLTVSHATHDWGAPVTPVWRDEFRPVQNMVSKPKMKSQLTVFLSHVSFFNKYDNLFPQIIGIISCKVNFLNLFQVRILVICFILHKHFSVVYFSLCFII